MPIKRKLAKQFDTWSRVVTMARDSVRLIKQPLSDKGWCNLISKEVETDMEMSTRIFEELITKRVIYMNDRTPEFKRYTWSGDLEYA